MSENTFEESVNNLSTQVLIEDEFEDMPILCGDCGQSFVWSVGEQAFFRDKKLQNPPKRCKECKQAKNERLAAIAAAQASGVRQRIEVAVSCAKCGETTTVPFYPSQGRPVFLPLLLSRVESFSSQRQSIVKI